MEDSLGDSLRVNPRETARYISPYLICLALYVAMSTLPSYLEHRAFVILFVNYVMAHMTFDMMLHNMADRKYSPIFQPLILLLVAPLLAYHVVGVTAETEKLLTITLTVLTFIGLILKYVILSRQWLDYTGKPFFYIRASDVANALKPQN